MGDSTQNEDRNLRQALRDMKKRQVALESEVAERDKRIKTGPEEFRDSLQEHEGGSRDIYRIHKECLEVRSAIEQLTSPVREKILNREDEEEESVTVTDDESFDDTCIWIHSCVEAALNMELEDLISLLKDEEKKFGGNNWSEGPYHMLLSANLILMHLSRDEWRASISRMDPEARASDLTTEQKNLMHRVEEAMSRVEKSVIAVAERNHGGPEGKRVHKIFSHEQPSGGNCN